MKFTLTLLAFLTCLSFSPLASADTYGNSGSSGGVKTKKVKKARPAPTYEEPVQQNSYGSSGAITGVPPAPTLVDGSNVLSARFGVGTITYVGVDFEHLFTQNFGGILGVRYGGYSNDFVLGGTTATYKYTVWAIAAQVAFHSNFIKIDNLDLYPSVGIVHGSLSSTYSTANGSSPSVVAIAADGNFWDVVAYANARYFFTPSFAVTGAVGTGLGIVNIGVDYAF